MSAASLDAVIAQPWTAPSVVNTPASSYPEVVAVILLAREVDAEPGQDLLIRAQVQRFGIREDAVEVEHDSLDHCRVPRAPIFSPARTGAASRFSRGGYGQS